MSNILRESGFQKKVLIGVAAAGLGIGAYYGISRLKSRPRGKDKSKSPKQDPAGGSDCEQLKQADKVPVHPNVKLDSDELHVNVCVDSHRSPEHNPAKEDPKQHDLSLSGTFEKISPPCSATSAESARQQSQASDALGESFEQLSLSQVQPLVEPEPQQDGNGQKSLYSLDSPIEDKYVQISISQAVESAPAALERTEQPSNPEDTSSSSPDTSSAHPPTEEQDGAGNKPTREQPSEVLSREQQPPVPAGGESPRVHGHDKEERADEYPSYSAVCVEAITQEVSASEEGHCSLSEDDNEFKEEEQNDIVLVEKKNESADNEPNQTEEFDPSKVSPVFGGRNVHKLSDNINLEDFDPSIAHPAFVGYAESEAQS